MEFLGDNLAGARFTDVNLTGARFREADLSQSHFSGVVLHDVEIDGDLRNLVVNGVRVDELVRRELEFREPVRRDLAGRTVAELRRGWRRVRDEWLTTEQELTESDPELVHRSVAGEWTALETMRHLVFVTDAWFRRAVLGLPEPFHAEGMPPPWMSELVAMGIEPRLRPGLGTVRQLLAEQAEEFEEWLAEAGDEDLALPGQATEQPGWPADPSAHTIGECVRVLLGEHWEHLRFCRRDLARLAERDAAQPGSTR